MSYRSKRTRALSLDRDSLVANDASQGPPKKTSSSKSVMNTPLRNTESESEKEIPKSSATLQYSKSTSARWGPFTPPLNTNKTSQPPLTMSKNGELGKPSSGYGQSIIIPKDEFQTKTSSNVAPQPNKLGGIWRTSPSGLIKPQKGQEVTSHQPSSVKNDNAAQHPDLPPLIPRKSHSSHTSFPLKDNVTSSHQPQKQPSFVASPSCDFETSINSDPQKGQEVTSHQPSSVKNDNVAQHSDLPPLIPKKSDSSHTLIPLKDNVTSSHQPQKQPSFAASPSCDIETSIDNDPVEELARASQGKDKEKKSTKAPQGKGKEHSGINIKLQASKFRHRMVIPSSLSNLEFDDKEEALTIDADGNHALVSGPINAIDVWNSNGVRYYVMFNEHYQPIRKGGKILTTFLSSIAKQERFCPIGELDWHQIDAVSKAEMISEIRDRFVIPDGEMYTKQLLQRIDKHWRQYKNSLKTNYYKPKEMSLEAHYNKVPGGISRDNWRKLVKHWFSDKGQHLSDNGKEARAAQCHFHTTGANSYANMRADYEDKHGEEMSLARLYEDAHRRKDGSFINGTCTEDLLADTKAKVHMLETFDTSGSKSRKEIEDEAFEAVMYGEEIPKRPQGFGFGVVKSDVYGVNGLLKKERYGKVRKRPVVEREDVNPTMSALEKQNEELRETVKQNTNLFMSVLEAIRSGTVSTELLDVAQSSLQINNPKAKNASTTPSDSKDVPPASKHHDPSST